LSVIEFSTIFRLISKGGLDFGSCRLTLFGTGRLSLKALAKGDKPCMHGLRRDNDRRGWSARQYTSPLLLNIRTGDFASAEDPLLS
jgi:hypothetical protein